MDGVSAFEAAVAAVMTRRDAAATARAEAWMQDLRRRPDALVLAKAAIETSIDAAVQIQAALLLRHAALRTWPSIAPDTRLAMRTWILAHVATHHSRSVGCGPCFALPCRTFVRI